ncbi:MAG: AbrB/MazE/SpoVT family DNA-binding domain-containing protein [Deltaproteobacteria bacterium]|nr:AbrB/MazE/SpoVT family DNA-binding domain-containing protein [Deltaproteobacteria bacterium]
MIKKLTRHGNSMALVIDKGVLELLDINDKTPLNISKEFEGALDKANREYGRALKRLAN